MSSAIQGIDNTINNNCHDTFNDNCHRNYSTNDNNKNYDSNTISNTDIISPNSPLRNINKTKPTIITSSNESIQLSEREEDDFSIIENVTINEKIDYNHIKKSFLANFIGGVISPLKNISNISVSNSSVSNVSVSNASVSNNSVSNILDSKTNPPLKIILPSKYETSLKIGRNSSSLKTDSNTYVPLRQGNIDNNNDNNKDSHNTYMDNKNEDNRRCKFVNNVYVKNNDLHDKVIYNDNEMKGMHMDMNINIDRNNELNIINTDDLNIDIKWKDGQLQSQSHSNVILRPKYSHSSSPGESYPKEHFSSSTTEEHSPEHSSKEPSSEYSPHSSIPRLPHSSPTPSQIKKTINDTNNTNKDTDNTKKSYSTPNISDSSYFSIPIPRMRILLMSVGTFGDIQPFATLGRKLFSDGHR